MSGLRRRIGHTLGTLGVLAAATCGAAGGGLPAATGLGTTATPRTGGASTPGAAPAVAGKPLLVDADQIAALRAAAAAGAADVAPGVAALRQAADKALASGPWAVADAG